MRKKVFTLIIALFFVIPTCVNALSAGIYSGGQPVVGDYYYNCDGSCDGNISLKYRLTYIPAIKFTLVDISDKNKMVPVSWHVISLNRYYQRYYNNHHSLSQYIFADQYYNFTGDCHKQCNHFGDHVMLGSIDANGTSYNATQYKLTDANYTEFSPGGWYFGTSSTTFDGKNDLKSYYVDDGVKNNYSRLNYPGDTFNDMDVWCVEL